MTEGPLLVMESITVRFGGRLAVADVSLALPRGATLALLGESGCGKTTLARVALGLIKPDAGTVFFDGAALSGDRLRRSVRKRMNMVFQDARASLDPRWTVRECVAEPLNAFRLIGKQIDPDERVQELLHMVGLPRELIRRRSIDLTAAQAQRVAIARALAADPVLLVCDEPTSALDTSQQAQVLNLLRNLQERFGLSILFISHDVGVVRHMADLVAVMHRGRLLEFGAAEAVFAQPRHPFTRQLLPAVPDMPTAAQAGAEDSLGGCVYRHRCPFGNARCAAETPALHWADGVAVACHAVEEARA